MAESGWWSRLCCVGQHSQHSGSESNSVADGRFTHRNGQFKTLANPFQYDKYEYRASQHLAVDSVIDHIHNEVARYYPDTHGRKQQF